MLPFVALPPIEIWPWILASAAFELLYRYLLIKAYRSVIWGWSIH